MIPTHFDEGHTMNTGLILHGDLEAQCKLLAAVAVARPKFKKVIKDTEGQIGNVKFKYANLAVLVEAAEEALAEQGVGVMQFLTDSSEEGRCLLTTIFAGHGAQIQARLSFTHPENVKEFGKLTTYLRRYAYQAAFVLDGDQDADQDGQANYPVGKRREPPRAPQPPQYPRHDAYESREVAREEKPRQPARPSSRPAPSQSAPPQQLKLSSVPPRQQTINPPDNKTSVRPPPIEDDGSPPTVDQLQTLRTLAVELNLSKVAVAQLCLDRYKSSAKTITSVQAEDLLGYFRGLRDDHQEVAS
jgi:hypothetical protein